MIQFERHATLLLIDDEPEVLASLTGVLAGAGYTCHTASCPEDASRLARSLVPDLIISDINLGGHSGLTLCEELKRAACLDSVPLMFLSGAQIPDIIRRSHAAGGTYYLRKPFDPNVLLELVEKALWMPHLISGKLAAV